VKGVVAEGVQVVLGDLIIDLLKLSLFISPGGINMSRLRLLVSREVAVLNGGLSLCEILLRRLRVVD
jgi:hypothetical protein